MLWPEHLASCPRGNLLANVGDGSKVDVSECPADVRFGSKADIAACPRNVRFTPKTPKECPLCAKSRHFALRHKLALFDHLVDAGKYCRRNGEAECFCGFKIDHQLVLAGCLHR